MAQDKNATATTADKPKRERKPRAPRTGATVASKIEKEVTAFAMELGISHPSFSAIANAVRELKSALASVVA